MRTFRDSDNSEWIVFEVRRERDAAMTDYLPGGYSEGWLCFENSSSKRRLLNYPERWRELTDVELQRMLSEARPAPRVKWRLGEDLDLPAG